MDKFGVFELISSLFNALEKEKKESPPPAAKKESQKNPRFKNTDLLKTAANHDEFLRRVYSANKKTP